MTQPNILFIMADQMAAAPLPMYGGQVVQAPHLHTLASQGIVFENAYCNSPICAPSRFSMLSARLPTQIGAYDNASEFPASTPTLAHYLCHAGYPLQLYDLEADPLERHNLAPDPSYENVKKHLLDLVLDSWDPDTLYQDILASQKRRLFLKQVAAKSGKFPDWSFQAGHDDTQRFVRAYGAAGSKAKARFPYVAPDDIS